MLCAATPDFSVRYILFLNASMKIPEGPDGTGFTSWLTFRLSLDFRISVLVELWACMALPHPQFVPLWPLLAFPVTFSDLTWERGCSTVGWLQLLFWVCRPSVTLSSHKWLSPLSLTPHMGCASGCASVCTRSCLLSLPFLSLCLKAEKHHFSCSLPLGCRQHGTRKVSQDSSVDSCI